MKRFFLLVAFMFVALTGVVSRSAEAFQVEAPRYWCEYRQPFPLVGWNIRQWPEECQQGDTIVVNLWLAAEVPFEGYALRVSFWDYDDGYELFHMSRPKVGTLQRPERPRSVKLRSRPIWLQPSPISDYRTVIVSLAGLSTRDDMDPDIDPIWVTFQVPRAPKVVLSLAPSSTAGQTVSPGSVQVTAMRLNMSTNDISDVTCEGLYIGSGTSSGECPYQNVRVSSSGTFRGIVDVAPDEYCSFVIDGLGLTIPRNGTIQLDILFDLSASAAVPDTGKFNVWGAWCSPANTFITGHPVAGNSFVIE